MIADTVELDKEKFGQKWVILGKSGSGKSHTARVAIEEGIQLGVTFTVIDPQEAYLNMPEFFYIDAKKVKRSNDLGILLAGTAKNTVISTKNMTVSEQNKFLKDFLEGFRTHSRKGIRTIVIDECHKYAGDYEKTEAREEVISMAQENRSDGIGFIAVEQRSQRLNKTILSQADYLVIHKLTAKRDLMSVEGYLDNPKEDLTNIKSLSVGKAYFSGFSDEPVCEQVRKSTTKHSGDSPKNLLTEDNTNFNRYINKIYNGGKQMGDPVNTTGEPIKDIIPSRKGFIDLVTIGAKMSLGMAASGFAGAFASRFKSPVPYVSNRTLASAGTMIVTYIGYRKIDNDAVKDILKYASAGAAVHTAGSLAFDILNATKIKVPNLVNFALVTTTGVPPLYSEEMQASEPGPAEADVNTAFAA